MSTMISSDLIDTKHTKPNQVIIFTKGAAEVVLGRCEKILTEKGSSRSLTPTMITTITTDIINTMAANSLRTIAISYKLVPTGSDLKNEELTQKGQTLIAICGIEDPLREEVPAAVAACRKAGITVRMLTGDNLKTAKSIAE